VAARPGFDAYSAASSRDSRRLAFTSDRDATTTSTSSAQRAPTCERSRTTWSTTRAQLVTGRAPDRLRPPDYERDRRAILVVDLATGAETESDDDFVSEPAWQPAGIE
jgi:hypothetical protein